MRRTWRALLLAGALLALTSACRVGSQAPLIPLLDHYQGVGISGSYRQAKDGTEKTRIDLIHRKGNAYTLTTAADPARSETQFTILVLAMDGGDVLVQYRENDRTPCLYYVVRLTPEHDLDVYDTADAQKFARLAESMGFTIAGPVRSNDDGALLSGPVTPDKLVRLFERGRDEIGLTRLFHYIRL